MILNLPKNITEFASIFKNNGFECYIVGGSVRDLLMGVTPVDYDWTTNAQPFEVKKIFKNYPVIETGIKHGTVTVIFGEYKFEVTTYRIESEYKDNRHPANIEFTSKLEEDLSRRDFTINAIAYDVIENKIIDYNNGCEDIKNKIIRAIGNPCDRFKEDALRILRCARLHSQLNFTIDEETRQGVIKNSKLIKNISVERIKSEIYKVFYFSEKPSIFFNFLRETNILSIILPDLNRTYGFKQNQYHQYDVYTHSLKSCDYCCQSYINLTIEEKEAKNMAVCRFAALLHDIGKVDTASVDEKGVIHFYRHEKVSSELAEKICNYLKLSIKEKNIICLLVKEHMHIFEYSKWNDVTVRKFIITLGAYIDELLEVCASDNRAKSDETANEIFTYQDLKDRINAIKSQNNALSLKDLKITGKDLINFIPAGPKLGEILNKLLEIVLEDPSKNEREILLTLAKEL